MGRTAATVPAQASPRGTGRLARPRLSVGLGANQRARFWISITEGLYMGGRALDQGAAAALEGMLPGSERAEPEGESGAVVPLKPARSAVYL